MARLIRRGKRLTKGSGWIIEATKGKKRRFRGTLVGTINYGALRLAIFRVPKGAL